jgi:monofunctional biosynthetic peptidoglycan transglycosylase
MNEKSPHPVQRKFIRRVKEAALSPAEGILYVILSPYRFFRWVCFVTGLLVWVFIAIIGVALYFFYSSMPDFEMIPFKEFKGVAQKQVFDKLNEKRVNYRWTPFDEISQDLLYAVVMGEDSGYFEHNGINYDALINAFAENIKRRKFVFGASTISQQVIKNVFLYSSKTITRKLKELIITRRMEERFTKNEILEIYLNIAEFGPDIFGVYMASMHYFHKEPKRINAAEGAFLALMLPSPKKYHYSIFRNKYLANRHKKKLRRILKDMLYKELISPDQYRDYINYSYFDERNGRR